MFRGINALTIDAKGRFAMPTRYREALVRHNKASLVITIEPTETCLLLYPILQWQEIEYKLQSLPSFHQATRRMQRLLIGHATDVELDHNGRVLLPNLLREYANLDKKIVLIGQGNKFELWDEILWQSKRAEWLAADKKELPQEMKSVSL